MPLQRRTTLALLAAPEPAGPLELTLTEVQGPYPSTRPWVRYEYVDPHLQTRSVGQRMMVRLGPDNERRVKAKLREFRALLAPQAPATVNLAHLMLGQGGTLAWVRGVTLADCPPAETGAACAPRADGLAPRTAGAVAAAPRQATALQARIKALFDPYGRFPEFTSPPNSDSL